MVQLLNNGTKSITYAWVLNIAILLITGLATIGVANLTWQFQSAITRLENVEKINHEQNLCLKELKVNQDIRLERERKVR